jgi:hypothetical protein
VIRGGARRFGAVAVGVLLLSACHASASVAIRVHSDGTGTVTVAVTLDHSARVALAGSPTAQPNVPLSDLRAHGWSVGSWRATANGGTAISLSKGFTGQAGLAAALADLDGRDGALRDAHVVRTRSLLRESDSVTLSADLRGLSTGISGDHELVTRLQSAGVDVHALEQGLQSQLGSAFDLSVDIVLPDGARTSVVVKPGALHVVSVASTSTHLGRLFALLLAAGAALLGLLMLLVAALNAGRARRL